MRRDEGGFTLVETLIAIALFGVLSAGFYSVLFSGVRGSDKTRDVVRVTEEARLGFNRIIRDTREGDGLEACESASFDICYRVKIDFNGDGAYSNPNVDGDYEDLRIRFNGANDEIRINGEALIAGVKQITGKDVFTYYSNFLEYDTNSNGVTTWQELDGSGIVGVGNGNGVLDEPELGYISSISYAFSVEEGEGQQDFYAEAQLRNRR